MDIYVKELAAKAMTPTGKARALLAERLVESLDQESVREIWLTEAKKRRDEVRSGQVIPIPGVEVIEGVRKVIDKK